MHKNAGRKTRRNTIMMISLITAWVATFCVIFTAFKYFAKKDQKMNRIFHRIHIPFGILLIAAGLVHGLFAGNPLGTTFRQATLGNVLFTWNMGTVCFILSILLGITYLLRKILKANWMKLHRILTVMLVVSLVIHIFQMGMKLPYAISSLGKSTGSSQGNNVEQIEVVDDSDSLVTFSGATLKDGIYEGSADGYASVITVSVVVENCAVISGELKITDIQISNSHGHGKPHHRPEH